MNFVSILDKKKSHKKLTKRKRAIDGPNLFVTNIYFK